MTGIILVTHGSLGEELLKTAEMIVGKQDRVELIAMQAGSSLSDVADALEAAIANHSGHGSVVFTDMFGGSPSNVAMAYLGDSSVEVVSGVNLPMLVKAFSLRMEGADMQRLSGEAAHAGRESIKIAGELLRQK